MLVVNKDRHGGVRAHCPFGDREPVAGTFKLLEFSDGVLEYFFAAPADGDRNEEEAAPPEDIAQVAALDPPPSTVEETRERLGWRKQRAANALRAFRDQADTASVRD